MVGLRCVERLLVRVLQALLTSPLLSTAEELLWKVLCIQCQNRGQGHLLSISSCVFTQSIWIICDPACAVVAGF